MVWGWVSSELEFSFSLRMVWIKMGGCCDLYIAEGKGIADWLLFPGVDMELIYFFPPFFFLPSFSFFSFFLFSSHKTRYYLGLWQSRTNQWLLLSLCLSELRCYASLGYTCHVLWADVGCVIIHHSTSQENIYVSASPGRISSGIAPDYAVFVPVRAVAWLTFTGPQGIRSEEEPAPSPLTSLSWKSTRCVAWGRDLSERWSTILLERAWKGTGRCRGHGNLHHSQHLCVCVCVHALDLVRQKLIVPRSFCDF